MFDAHLMIRANNRAFQETPHAFNSVSVNVTDNPFLCGVINPTMFGIGVLNAPISGHFVSVDRFGVWRGIVMNKFVQRRFVSVRNNLQSDFAPTLNGSNGDGLISFVATAHTMSLSADISFIHFNDTAQKIAVNLAHGRTDTVAQIPSRL